MVQKVLDREHDGRRREILDMIVCKLRSKGDSTCVWLVPRWPEGGGCVCPACLPFLELLFHAGVSLRYQLLERMDNNGDGVLSAGEFKDGLEQLGIPCTTEEIGSLMRYFDVDGNGTLDALEVEQVIKKHRISPESMARYGDPAAQALADCIAAASKPTRSRTQADVAKIFAHIRSIKFLEDFSQEQGLRLCRAFTVVERAAGDFLFMQGEPGDSFFILLTGEVGVVINRTEVKTMHATTSFGEAALTQVACLTVVQLRAALALCRTLNPLNAPPVGRWRTDSFDCLQATLHTAQCRSYQLQNDARSGGGAQ